MAVKLSPLFMDAQLINAIPANGAKLFTYAAGSTTKQTTYTDSTGSVANSNPIILNSRGEPPNPIWLTSGQTYKFVFTASTDTDPPSSPIRTIDNISGVNDTSLQIDQWVASSSVPTYISTSSFTVAGDQTSSFQIGRRVKLNVTAGTVLGYISSSVYGALTTVGVTLDSGVLDSGLSSVSLGLLTPNNPSTPLLTDSYPIVSGNSDKSKKLKFEIDGFTTATTRTITWPDKDLTPADAADISNKLLGIVTYTASGTASASDVGKLTYLNAATAQTLTLPAVASCPIGTVLSYVNIIGLGTWTIQRGGSALIFGMGGNSLTSIQLTPQSSIQFTNDGTNWVQISASNLNLLGTNGTSYTSAVNYLAATDGFVFGRCFSSGTPMSLTVFSDSTTTPTTTLLECGTNTGTNNYWIPFCAPIKKGNYWRIVMGAGSAPTINFTPMGV